MLAEFTIYPLNGTHLSGDVARVIAILEAVGVEYRLSPLGTIDACKDEPHHLDEMISVVEKHLGHAAKQTGRKELVREA